MRISVALLAFAALANAASSKDEDCSPTEKIENSPSAIEDRIEGIVPGQTVAFRRVDDQENLGPAGSHTKPALAGSIQDRKSVKRAPRGLASRTMDFVCRNRALIAVFAVGIILGVVLRTIGVAPVDLEDWQMADVDELSNPAVEVCGKFFSNELGNVDVLYMVNACREQEGLEPFSPDASLNEMLPWLVKVLATLLVQVGELAERYGFNIYAPQ